MKKNGFTLIELILVVSLMLTLGVMTTVFYSRFLTQSSVSNVQDQLLSSLRKAQIYAMTSKRGSSWGVRYGSNTITLYKGTTFGTEPAFDEKFSVDSTISITSSTGIVDWNFTRITGNPNNSPAAIIISGQNNLSKTINIYSHGLITR